MKNKFIIIFLTFIFSLNSLCLASADEFNFDITELQVTEDGNLIKGIKGGIATTKNNEIVIIADNFTYNKLSTLLEAKGNVKLIDKIADVVVKSNEIFYLKNEEKIYTIGKTNINIKKQYNIDGYDFTLLKNKMLLSTDQKAIITDNDLSVYEFDKFQYSINDEILKGEEIKITKNKGKLDSDLHFFKEGFFNLKEDKFLGKDVNIIFHKTLFDDRKNDPRMKGVTGYGNEYNTYLDKAVFSSCKKTDTCPPWKMRATKIQHDKVKKRIIYKNAWLDIFDFPVVYFPKFYHPDPSVERQSGLIRPEISDHSTLGDSIYLPYFVVLSDDKDMTIKPRIFNSGVTVLQSEYRQITRNSVTLIDGSITKSHDSSKYDKDDNRTHLFANSKIDLDIESFINSDLEINYQNTSNDTYLQLFDFMKSPLITNKDIRSLETSATLDLEHRNYDFSTSVRMYESFGGTNSDKYSYVLPSYSFTKIFDLENLSGTFDFSTSGSNTLSQTNVLTSTIDNDLTFSTYDFFSTDGITTNAQALFKNTNAVGKNSIDYKNSPQAELISIYLYNISLPLGKDNEKYTSRLTPKLSFRASPHNMKDKKPSNRSVNADNIFNINRLSLRNTFESGESLTLGLDFNKEVINSAVVAGTTMTEIEEYFDFKLATVFRLNEEKSIPTKTTLNKTSSNIFGKADFTPNKITTIGYEFSLTNDLNRFENNALNLGFKLDNFSTKFTYSEQSGAMGDGNVIANTTKFNFNKYNSLSIATQRNREINLTEFYDLIYEYKNDCLIADIKYRKDYYEKKDKDIKPKEELFFSITIVPFYTYSPDKMILNKDRID